MDLNKITNEAFVDELTKLGDYIDEYYRTRGMQPIPKGLPSTKTLITQGNYLMGAKKILAKVKKNPKQSKVLLTRLIKDLLPKIK